MNQLVNWDWRNYEFAVFDRYTLSHGVCVSVCLSRSGSGTSSSEHTYTRYLFLNTISHEKVPGLLREMADSGPGAGKCRRSMEHRVPEEVFRAENAAPVRSTEEPA